MFHRKVTKVQNLKVVVTEIEDPQSSDCDTTPPAPKIRKGEGWEWSGV